MPRDQYENMNEPEQKVRVITLTKTVKADLKTIEQKQKLKAKSFAIPDDNSLSMNNPIQLGIDDFTLYTVGWF